MKKLVLLDIDSTLLEAPSEANAPSSAIMFKKVFSVDAHEEMVENVGKTERRIILEVLRDVLHMDITDVPHEAYKAWGEATKEALKKQPAQMLPGVLDLLHGLSEKNITYGVLTGNNSYRARAKLQSVDIDSYFQDGTGKLRGAFGEMAYDREELIDKAKEQMGFLKEDMAILIDDSRFVAKMIARLNLPHVMVATGTVPFEELKEYVHNVIPTFANNGWREAIRIIEDY